MKKLMSWLLACSFLLICGCGSQKIISDNNTDSQEIIENTPITDDLEMYSEDIEKSNQCSHFTIFENEEYTIELLTVIDYSTFAESYLVRFTNSSDCWTVVNLNSIVLNDNITDDESVSVDCNSGTTGHSFFNYINQKLMYAQESRLYSIKGSISISTNDGNILEDTFEINFPESYNFELLCETFMDALANEQVIADNENVRINLIGAGQFCGNENYFSGIISVENKNNYEIPVEITNIIINGITIEIYSSSGTLQPLATGYFNFEIYKSDLIGYGIKSITSAAMTILTSDSENTGYVAERGGTVYPVFLSQVGTENGNANYQPTSNDLVYEDDNFSIYYISHETESYNYNYWKLWVENKTDHAISFSIGNQTLIDGNPICHNISVYGEIAADASGLCQIYSSEIFPGYFPSLSLQLLIKSVGGDELFTTIDVTLNKESYKLLTDTGDIQIYYSNVISSNLTNGYYNNWIFVVNNNSDVTVNVSVQDLTPDTISDNSDSINIATDNIVSGKLFYTISDTLENQISDVTFCLVISNSKTGEVIYTSDIITLSQ